MLSTLDHLIGGSTMRMSNIEKRAAKKAKQLPAPVKAEEPTQLVKVAQGEKLRPGLSGYSEKKRKMFIRSWVYAEEENSKSQPVALKSPHPVAITPPPLPSIHPEQIRTFQAEKLAKGGTSVREFVAEYLLLNAGIFKGKRKFTEAEIVRDIRLGLSQFSLTATAKQIVKEVRRGLRSYDLRRALGIEKEKHKESRVASDEESVFSEKRDKGLEAKQGERGMEQSQEKEGHRAALGISSVKATQKAEQDTWEALEAPKKKVFTAQEDALIDEAQRLIKKLGMSQRELAKVTGKSQPLISLIMTRDAKAAPSFVNQLRHEAGEKLPTGTSKQRELNKIIDSFPETAREEASNMILAFARNLREKFD